MADSRKLYSLFPATNEVSSAKSFCLNDLAVQAYTKDAIDFQSYVDEMSVLLADEADALNQPTVPAHYDSSKYFDVEILRTFTDYQEASSTQGPIIMGRVKEKQVYLNNQAYIGRILHPERRGEAWTLDKNAAFWAGAIECGLTFLIVSPLEAILQRAKDGYNNYRHTEGSFGGAFFELLWLADNGYTLIPHKLNPNWTVAIPPKQTIPCAILRIDYGHRSQADALQQITRVQNIAAQLYEVANKSKPTARR